VKARLRGFGVEDLILAVRGIWISTWNVSAGQTSFDLALRDAAHVEKFRDLGERGFDPNPVRNEAPAVQRAPGYQAEEERKRAAFQAEAAAKQRALDDAAIARGEEPLPF